MTGRHKNNLLQHKSTLYSSNFEQKEEKQIAWASVSAKSGHCAAETSALWEEQREGTTAELRLLLGMKEQHKDVITVVTRYKVMPRLTFRDKSHPHRLWARSPVARYSHQCCQDIKAFFMAYTKQHLVQHHQGLITHFLLGCIHGVFWIFLHR